MQDRGGGYARFGAMIAASMLVMFALMYLNAYEAGHVRFSQTRLFMTFIMGAGMAVVMLSFMQAMYRDKRANLAIYAASVLVFAFALWLARSQATVDDRAYMSAMIPHHSIAILTSERARIEDARVRTLADEIMRAQRREIREMEWLIDDIAANGPARTETEVAARPVPAFNGDPQAEEE